MEERNKKMELMGQVPIPRALLAMGLPTMLGMMVNALYNLVDAYFVGGLGTSQMGAIAVAFPLGQIVVGLGLLFGTGAASYISRLLGYGDQAAANQVASTALYGSLLVGVVLVLAALAFLRPLLQLFGATAQILPYAMTYTRIYLLAAIFNVCNVTMNSLMTSEGAAKTTMCALLAGAVLNMILDPILIYTLKLGVAGAAIATAISQLVTTTVYLFYMIQKKSMFRFRLQDCCFSKAILAEIMKIGVPTLVFQLLTGLSILLINLQAKAYSDSVIAAMGAVTRILAMGSLMVFGFIKGFQPIAGYSWGARKYERLQEAIRIAILWSTAFCVLFGLGMAIGAERIIAQFTVDDLELIAVGTRALRAGGISFVLFGYYTVYSSLFLALGKGIEGFFLGACRQGICFVPVILLLPLFWGLDGMIYAQPIADVLSALFTAAMAWALHKELHQQALTAIAK